MRRELTVPENHQGPSAGDLRGSADSARIRESPKHPCPDGAAADRPADPTERIAYVAKWGLTYAGQVPTEEYIRRALISLGCEVVPIDFRETRPFSYRLVSRAGRRLPAADGKRRGGGFLRRIVRGRFAARLASEISRCRPSIVLFSNFESWPEELGGLLRVACGPETVLAVWNFDKVSDRTEPKTGKSAWFLPLARACDIAFVKERGAFDFFRAEGINPVWLDQAAVDGLPFGSDEYRTPEFECDVAFLGGTGDESRSKFVVEIGRHVDLKVFSAEPEAWRALGIRNAHGPVFDDRMPSLTASAGICLGLNAGYEMEGCWSNRIYWILGAGGFCLMKRVPGMDGMFRDGEHLVYFESLEEALDKIGYYLRHPEERERIRRRGYEYVHRYHTYTARCREFLDHMTAFRARRPRTGGIRTTDRGETSPGADAE